MADTENKLSRRNFLLAAGAGGAATAAAVAVVAKIAPQPANEVAGRGKRATRGYLATEHVHSYYRTTKV